MITDESKRAPMLAQEERFLRLLAALDDAELAQVVSAMQIRRQGRDRLVKASISETRPMLANVGKRRSRRRLPHWSDVIN